MGTHIYNIIFLWYFIRFVSCFSMTQSLSAKNLIDFYSMIWVISYFLTFFFLLLLVFSCCLLTRKRLVNSSDNVSERIMTRQMLPKTVYTVYTKLFFFLSCSLHVSRSLESACCLFWLSCSFKLVFSYLPQQPKAKNLNWTVLIGLVEPSFHRIENAICW